MHVIIRAVIALLALPMFAAEVAVTIKADDLLRFSTTSISAKAGDTLVITVTNSGKMASQKHNFVLLKGDAQVGRFGESGSADGIPDNQREFVIISTPYLKAGESKTLRFAAPPPGSYTFICAYPGHHSMSKGTLTVR